MLSLLATILSWNDGEREKAGLQRAGGPSASTSWSRTSASGPSGKGKGAAELDTSDETEVHKILIMFIIFYLTRKITSTVLFTKMGRVPTPRIFH